LGILFFGLPAGVSAAVLAALVESGMDIRAVVVPARAVPHLLPESQAAWAYLNPHRVAAVPLAAAGEPADTLGVAWAAGLPVLAGRDFAHPDTLAALAATAADVAVVACFTERLPAAALRVPRLGFLNLHPSLLPAYRGPTPVFWQLRDGAPTGVTVHYLDEGLDTGDIAAQVAVPVPDGILEAAAERRLMLAGLDLLRDILTDLAGGVARRRPQPPGGSYVGFPDAGDFTLSVDWPARRAYNFMRATAGRGMPYLVEINGRMERLAVADHYEPDLQLDRPSVRHGRNLVIRFNPGILYARAAR
jgi:methionyl-tRNA formyltransferase